MGKFLGERLDLIEGLKHEADRRRQAMKSYERRALTPEEVSAVVALMAGVSQAEEALESEEPVKMLRTYKRLIEMEVK